jgi:Ca2+-binding EF-hand superfamily protein
LVRKYGNLLRAWRDGLDTDRSGKLSFTEFCKSARDNGFAGSVKDIWREMDADNTGFISLDEFCPEIGELFFSFIAVLRDRHGGSLVRAWKETLDTNRSGTVSQEEFRVAMEGLGWSGDDALRVYRLLDFDRSGFVTIEEVDHQAALDMERGDDLLGLDVIASDDHGDSLKRRKTLQQKRNEALGAAKRKELEARAAETKRRNVGATTPEEFKAALTRKYGNLLRAWRKGLDLDGNGRLGFAEFCAAAKGHAYHGNIRALWKSYDVSGEGMITLEEFAPAVAELYGGLVATLRGAHGGSLVRAWKESLDTNKSGTVSREEFVEAISGLGWTEDNAARVYKLLDFDRSGFITLDEIDAKAAAAMVRGDDLLGLDVENGKRKTRTRVQDGSTAASRRNEAQGKEQRQRTEAAERARKAALSGATNLTQWKERLSRQYGNLLRAWRNGLDADGNGRLSYGEFCTAGRQHGYAGDLRALWNELDATGEGLISLGEFCPEVAGPVEAFLRCLREAHGGSLVRAWNESLDTNRSGTVTREEFMEVAERLRFAGDAAMVYRLFDFDKSGFITLDEIDPVAHNAMLLGHQS